MHAMMTQHGPVAGSLLCNLNFDFLMYGRVTPKSPYPSCHDLYQYGGLLARSAPQFFTANID